MCGTASLAFMRARAISAISRTCGWESFSRWGFDLLGSKKGSMSFHLALYSGVLHGGSWEKWSDFSPQCLHTIVENTTIPATVNIANKHNRRFRKYGFHLIPERKTNTFSCTPPSHHNKHNAGHSKGCIFLYRYSGNLSGKFCSKVLIVKIQAMHR